MEIPRTPHRWTVTPKVAFAIQKKLAARLVDRGKIVGSVLRSQDGVKPVFVSVGHKIDLATAEEVVLACAPRYRLPEPCRLADQLADATKGTYLRQERGRQEASPPNLKTGS